MQTSSWKFFGKIHLSEDNKKEIRIWIDELGEFANYNRKKRSNVPINYSPQSLTNAIHLPYFQNIFSLFEDGIEIESMSVPAQGSPEEILKKEILLCGLKLIEKNVPAPLVKEYLYSYIGEFGGYAQSFKANTNVSGDESMEMENYNTMSDRLKSIEEKLNTPVVKSENVPGQFSFLIDIQQEILIDYVMKQNDLSKLSIVLSYLPVPLVRTIISKIDTDKAANLLNQLANLPRITQEELDSIESEVKEEISDIKPFAPKTGGIDFVTEIFRGLSRNTEKEIITILETDSPELSEQLKASIFKFDDICKLDDRAIQKVMREVDNTELAKALKAASPQVQNKIFRNMSNRSASLLKEDMDFMGPVRLKDVNDSQQKIINIISKLEQAGEIVIASEEDELVL